MRTKTKRATVSADRFYLGLASSVRKVLVLESGSEDDDDLEEDMTLIQENLGLEQKRKKKRVRVEDDEDEGEGNEDDARRRIE